MPDSIEKPIAPPAGDLYSALRELEMFTLEMIQSGQWPIDGACDPDLILRRARKAIEAHSSTYPTQRELDQFKLSGTVAPPAGKVLIGEIHITEEPAIGDVEHDKDCTVNSVLLPPSQRICDCGDVEKLIERLNDYGRPLWATDRDEAAAMLRSLAAEITEMKKKDWDLENDALLRKNDELAVEATDAKATLAGQSAHVIDLELAVDRLAAEKAKVEEAMMDWHHLYVDVSAKLDEVVSQLRDMTKAYDSIRAKLERAREALELCSYALNPNIRDLQFNVMAAYDKARATLEAIND